jgi:2-dehydro-3-deoxyphosphooctonate aldolase (KDO 8-P synthase)
MKIIHAGSVEIGGRNLCVIAGPCVLESEEIAFKIAQYLIHVTGALGLGYIFKASFDKANRSSIRSFRGPGLKRGLKILAKIREKLDVPVLTDVHCVTQVPAVADVVDVIQIPAFLCRQTDLLSAAARTGKPVNVKKGQFLAPWEAKNIVEKILSEGNDNIIITERGTSFGYNNLVVDFRSLPIMRAFGYPVVFDGTHSVQQPGGLGTHSGGQREFVEPLCRAAVAVGCDGIFIEVHPEPDRALSDGPNMIALTDVEQLLRKLKKLRETDENPDKTD